MYNNVNELKRGQLTENCAFIKKYCENHKYSETADLVAKCDRLVESLEFIDETAESLRFEDVPANGFLQLIHVATAYTDQIVNQIKTKNRIDPNLLEIFVALFNYRDWLFDVKQTLKDEARGSMICKGVGISTRRFYDAVQLKESVHQLILSSYIGFWLSEELRKLIKGSKGSEVFLRKNCNNLAGISILSVDYSLTVPFPVQNQEILDVYLWALSGKKEVEEMLGFNPTKVVVSGDSAGGLLGLSLTIMVNELNKVIDKSRHHRQTNVQPYKNNSYTLPSALVTAYPVYSMVNCTPSKTLFTLEPFLEIHAFLIMYSAYGANVCSMGDFEKLKNNELFQQIVGKNKEEHSPVDIATSSQVNETSPWFACDYETYRNHADYIASFYTNPIINPTLYYDKFDELKSVALYAFVGDQDVLQDDSVELCRQWKGEVHLDVMKNNMHGFLTFSCLSKISREALDFVVVRYQEACGLLK